MVDCAQFELQALKDMSLQSSDEQQRTDFSPVQGFADCMDAYDETGRDAMFVTAEQTWDTMSHPITHSSSATGSPSSHGDPGLQDSYMLNSAADPLAATSTRLHSNSSPCLPAGCESPPASALHTPALTIPAAYQFAHRQQQPLAQNPQPSPQQELSKGASATFSAAASFHPATIPPVRAFPLVQPLSMAMLMQASQSLGRPGSGLQMTPTPTPAPHRNSIPGMCRSASSTLPGTRGPVVPMSASFVPAPAALRPSGQAAPKIPSGSAAGPADSNKQKRKSMDVRRASVPSPAAAGSSGVSRAPCAASSGISAAAAAAQASSLFSSSSMAGMMASMGMNPMGMGSMGLAGPLGMGAMLPGLGGLMGGGMPGMMGLGGIGMGLPSFMQPALPAGTVWGTPMNPQAQAPGICPPALAEPVQPVPLPGRPLSSPQDTTVPFLPAPMTIFPPISAPSTSQEQLSIARMSNHSHRASSRRSSMTRPAPAAQLTGSHPTPAALPLSMSALLAISASTDSSRLSFSGDRNSDGLAAATGISALCADLLDIPPRRGSSAAAAAAQRCSLLSGSEQLLCAALSEDCDMFGFSGEQDESRKMARCGSQLYLPSLEDLMEPEDDGVDGDREQRMMGFRSHHPALNDPFTARFPPGDARNGCASPLLAPLDSCSTQTNAAGRDGRTSTESTNQHRVRFSDSLQRLSIADEDGASMMGGSGSAGSSVHHLSLQDFCLAPGAPSNLKPRQQQQQQQGAHMMSSLYDMGGCGSRPAQQQQQPQNQFASLLQGQQDLGDSFDLGGFEPSLDDVCGVGERYLSRDDSFLNLSMQKCDSLLHMIGSIADLQAS
ncbi:MAG: hypothetical protein WDW38_001301 [Sanguina aurantia]